MPPENQTNLPELEQEGLGHWDEDGEWVHTIYIPPEPEPENPPEEDCA